MVLSHITYLRSSEPSRESFFCLKVLSRIGKICLVSLKDLSKMMENWLDISNTVERFV